MTETPERPLRSALELAAAMNQPPPTPEQRAVIESGLDPLLVVAGAGSGKTATMAARVVYLVANRLVEPGQILGLTFTRKAAAELADRVRASLRAVAALDPELDLTDPPRIATYNSYAGSIVRDHALRGGVDPDATLIGDAGRFQLAEEIVARWQEDLGTTRAAGTLVDAVTALSGELSEHGLTPAQAAAAITRLADELEGKAPEGRQKAPMADVKRIVETLHTKARLLDVVAAFVATKRERGLLDFGDQVRIAADIARAVPAIGAGERSRYRAVLLDEYQDTSIAQVQLLHALFGDGAGAEGRGHPVTAVGDPNQAIYGWRGAAAGTLLDFPTTFAAADGRPAGTATLSTAWRNSTRVLEVANRIALPLRNCAERPELARLVPVLTARPDAPQGRVHARYAETTDAEADAVAAFLRGLGWGTNRPPGGTAAVLCRKRAMFVPVTAALTRAGIPFQVVGLAGLLDTPEVADVWAALRVAHDPSRGDVLMRLLTGPSVRLGAADLALLGRWSQEQARRRLARRDAVDAARAVALEVDPDAPVLLEEAEQASIVEALDQLPPAHWRDPFGRGLSDAARRRLARLGDQLRQVRSLGHLSLPDLVTATEQVLGLDIEVLAQVPGSVGHARRNLDEFTSAAATFAGDADAPTLGAFLSWLEAAYDQERGLDTVEAEPDPGVVQVLTVHAAKGLEWDTVAVVGLNESDFPNVTIEKATGERVSNGWLGDLAALPYELRGDHRNLPDFDHELADTHPAMKQVREDFRRAEGARALGEERRLAYVAVTRARTRLLLTGSFWGTRTTVSTPSVFLTEALTCAPETGGPWPARPEHEQNPSAEAAVTAAWPGRFDAARQRWARLAAVAGGSDERVDAWRADAALLLAERAAARAQAGDAAPTHLSASAVVALAGDPEAFLRNRRRPVPKRPSLRARRGTRFHGWIERYYGSAALLDWEGLPGAEDGPDAGPEEGLEDLVEAFLASPWAARRPIRVEADVETPVGGIMIRCRIDAVFAEEDGGAHVVDWKTGRAPLDASEREARDLQLVLYRIAWSRMTGLPLERVRASFHYVADGVTVSAPDLDEGAVEAVLAGLEPGLAQVGPVTVVRTDEG